MIYQKEAHIDHVLKSLEKAIEQKETELKEIRKEQHHASIFSFLGSEIMAPLEGVKHVLGSAEGTMAWGFDKARESIKEDPWNFLKKVAMGSLSLGMMLGSRYKAMQRKERT